MGKKKSSTPVERKIIWTCYENVGSVAKVVKILSLSRGKVVNAIKHYKQFTTFNNLPRNVPRKTSAADDRLMVRMSKADPFFTSSQIRSEMEQKYNVIVSSRTVRRRLVESGLHGRIARRKPNVTKRNLIQRRQFAKKFCKYDHNGGMER
ncbi:uncharacterized protein LOC142238569 [Haematobia irritans]|uniref:uncharacterized protein LOC142238569 n=1 Tax=Haematobia irritans TaxID=7368 RepID=UPI003F503012